MKPADYNDDELKGMAPKLSSIQKKEAFSVPDNYFDSLSDKIMDKISSVPDFEKAAVTNPFTVPENYFEKLPLAIMSRIEAEKSKRFSLAGLLAQAMRPKYSMSLITACFALFVCIRFFEKPIMMHVYESTAESISISDIEVLGGVDESMLMDEISQHDALLAADHKGDAQKEMEDYIINNNIDISDIAKEL
jgi:hypothetical protein